jgi:hypothetical protein
MPAEADSHRKIIGLPSVEAEAIKQFVRAYVPSDVEQEPGLVHIQLCKLSYSDTSIPFIAILGSDTHIS